MSDEDFVATTNEKLVSIEYVPETEIKLAFVRGIIIGGFIVFLLMGIMMVIM